MRARCLVVVIALVAFGAPTPSHAQCELTGRGQADAVRPAGTELALDVDEEARFRLDQDRVRVSGLSPIVFEGEGRVVDLHLSLAAERRLLGIVTARAGTVVTVMRVRGDRVAARIDAGPVRLHVHLRCSDLSLEEPAAGATDDDDDETAEAWARVRGDVLAVFTSAHGGRAVTLRRASWRGAWPTLAVVERRGDRLHVRGTLGADVTVDGWVARESVRVSSEWSESSPDHMGSTGGCGHRYAGESYRGAATLAAGTALEDERGRVWGHLATALEASVVVSTLGTVTRDEGGQTITRRVETVWVDRLPGLVDQPCRGLGVRVARSAVTLRDPPADR